MKEKTHLFPSNPLISREQRNQRNGHKSHVLWLTGLSGSGKSTLSNLLEQKLFDLNIQVFVLDGDRIRQGINDGLGFTREDRRENLRRMAEVAKLFLEAGFVVISAAISPLKKDRKMIEEILGAKFYSEIFVDTSLETCEERDVKGLYKKARQGEIEDFTGISAPYEKPENPNLRIHTENRKIEDCVQELYDYIQEKIKL